MKQRNLSQANLPKLDVSGKNKKAKVGLSKLSVSVESCKEPPKRLFQTELRSIEKKSYEHDRSDVGMTDTDREINFIAGEHCT